MIDYLVITPFFPSSDSFRGSYLLDQAKAIQYNSNYNLLVIILSPFLDKSQGDYTIEGVSCKTFRVFDFPSFILPAFFNTINLKRFGSFLEKHKIKVSSKSIIHGHINYPSLNFLDYFSRKFSCNTILQHHGLDILQEDTGIVISVLKWVQNKLILKRFNRLSEQVTTHIAVSSIVKSNLIKINPRLENKIFVSVNGVDTKKFYVKPSQKLSKSKYIIGCVANFWELKDQMTLLKAVNTLKDKGINNLHIKFVGSGKTLNRCFEYAKKKNIDCEFINELKHTELLSFYNQLDLFVLPSKYEAFGCVYLEALACGVPFIGVKNQGIEDIVKNDFKKYQLVEEGAFVDLSKLIYYFYSNKLTIQFDKKYRIENTIKKMLNHIIAQ
ncbi:MAG: glycosyltransferase family 4 protein [Flavobacteriales bacterium]